MYECWRPPSKAQEEGEGNDCTNSSRSSSSSASPGCFGTPSKPRPPAEPPIKVGGKRRTLQTFIWGPKEFLLLLRLFFASLAPALKNTSDVGEGELFDFLIGLPSAAGDRIAAGMQLVPVALIYLGSFAFLGADTARLDLASEFRKKWNKWVLNRGKRELRVPGNHFANLAEVKTGPIQTFIRPQDVKGASRSPQPSNPDAAHIRVKRYRQSMNSFPHFQSLRIGCRFGTCTLQNLAHQIYQLTDKDKDGSAPPNKISPQGYGRRRRRSLTKGSPVRTIASSSSSSGLLRQQ